LKEPLFLASESFKLLTSKTISCEILVKDINAIDKEITKRNVFNFKKNKFFFNDIVFFICKNAQ
jgi:hypothetical protein